MFITGAFLILAHCATRHGSQNFQDVVQEVLGQRAYVFIQIVIIVYMFASCLPYMILIGDQLESGKPDDFLAFVCCDSCIQYAAQTSFHLMV